MTHLDAEENALVFLASYSKDGQFSGLMAFRLKDVPVGSSLEVSLLVNNSSGEIGMLKAFAVSSLQNLQPLGNEMEVR